MFENSFKRQAETKLKMGYYSIATVIAYYLAMIMKENCFQVKHLLATHPSTYMRLNRN